MCEQTLVDLRRELEKARQALIAAQTHLAARAEMNAALHCAASVIHSPLHARVTAAITGIEQTLERHGDPADEADEAFAAGILASVLGDLDRCMHGRHQGDACLECPGGISRGNPHMPTGTVIGYDISGRQIVMPDREHKHDPDAWRPRRRQGGGDA